LPGSIPCAASTSGARYCRASWKRQSSP
jgi:hypothetical protein